MHLNWHNYKYFPYEKDLAIREVKSLLRPASINHTGKTIYVDSPQNKKMAKRLVYFSQAIEKGEVVSTQQSVLEKINGNGVKRQSTRYSAHGLHEYKGKFNPQMAKAILNLFNTQPGQLALDPFCGSGTSLVECAHLGIESIGTDINPFAIFVANAKLKSLRIPGSQLRSDAEIAIREAKKKAKPQIAGDRGEYLTSWFPQNYLKDIENLRIAVESLAGETAPVLLALASNLLRDYSLQEPSDLRIRRRMSEFPSISFFDAFSLAVQTYSTRIDAAQDEMGLIVTPSRAIHIDCKSVVGHPEILANTFDLALTSPPYATALPYIDTQRLSLVWLGLIDPRDLAVLEADLIGSREIRRQNKKDLQEAIYKNPAMLPQNEVNFCLKLQNALGENDGFRRQMVPCLLYRYFAGMANAFSAVHSLLKPNSPFALIVGGNHTVLGGRRFEIDTPTHLTSIATSMNFEHIETIRLQTYQRYGLHANNATNTEALIILHAT